MKPILIIIKILCYAFIIKVTFRWSHNILFMILKKPIIWIIAVGLLGFLNMFFFWYFKWDPRIAGAATLLALGWSKNPEKPKWFKGDWKSTMDEFFVEFGIPNGRKLSSYGFIVFAISSVISYVCLFAEVSKA